MRKVQIVLLILILLAVPVNAAEFTAPSAPQEVQRYLPDETDDLGEGLWFVISNVLKELRPNFTEAVHVCVSLIAVSLLVSLLLNITGKSCAGFTMAGTSVIAILMLQPTDSMLQLGAKTIEALTEYGKLLIPVLTYALAAQGAVTKSTVMYTASAFVNSLLSSVVLQILVPLSYILLCVCISNRFFDHRLLHNIRSFIKWLVVWGLKIVLYVFTGYVSITGIISGTTDAAALKATKLAISGMVPVVGSILSDASEAVLVSVGLMKNAAGIYGILTVIALSVGPFVQAGIQYLMLMLSSGICHMFGIKEMAALIKDLSDIMGLMVAMIGTVSVIILISTVCFMKGMT